MKKLIIILGSISILSCNNIIDTDYAAPNFPKTEEIKFTILNNDLPASNPQGQMIICDSVAIVQAICIENKNVFQVFRLGDGQLVRGFAYRGRAANELNDYRRITLSRDGKTLHAMENGGVRSIDIDLTKAISGETSYVVKTYRLPRGPISREIHSAGENILHTENVGKMPRFVITNRECTDTICTNTSYMPTKTVIDEDENDIEEYYFYNSAFGVRPDGKRGVNVTRNGMLMEIYEIQNNKMQSIGLRRFHCPKMGNNMRTGADDCVRGAFKLYTTNKYIYVNYIEQTKLAGSPISSVAVFDWNGKEVAQYKSNLYISTFAVTPNDNRVYCWIFGPNGEEALCYFELK